MRFLRDQITTHNLGRIVIAGDIPGYYKPVFTRAMAMAGGNTDEIRLASFQEHGARGENAMDRAKAIVACATMGVPFPLAAVPGGNPVNHATLIIGGGIAGIQSALEIANAGKQVFLVEQTGTIGGHMAMFDKTFPTLDCAACILTPKMSAVKSHPNITLWTYSEVEKVDGFIGNFKVTVRRKARYVDEDKCTGCQLCIPACPYDALTYDDNRNLVIKCTLCHHRIDQGLEPFCVVLCEDGSIFFGDLNDPESKVSKLISQRNAYTLKPEAGTAPKPPARPPAPRRPPHRRGSEKPVIG